MADWVAVFHQDDVMLPGHLARHAAVIERLGSTRKLGMMTGAAAAIDSAGEIGFRASGRAGRGRAGSEMGRTGWRTWVAGSMWRASSRARF